ncbi:MAG: zf-HC2 domain-containing protein [Candidatus Omnitrophica bacterium]|nr:zf-HC2 domain-containing protein [Candidatus Omnitrophota bacterium]
MAGLETKLKVHPTESEIADFLSRSLSVKDRERIETHLASCDECLARVVSAYDSVSEFKKAQSAKKRKDKIMKKFNIYLFVAVICFALSFTTPRYFLQLLVATLILGIKWIVDSKSTKMLIMIYEAWKKGGEKEASRILETLNSEHKNRI